MDPRPGHPLCLESGPIRPGRHWREPWETIPVGVGYAFTAPGAVIPGFRKRRRGAGQEPRGGRPRPVEGPIGPRQSPPWRRSPLVLGPDRRGRWAALIARTSLARDAMPRRIQGRGSGFDRSRLSMRKAISSARTARNPEPGKTSRHIIDRSFFPIPFGRSEPPRLGHPETPLGLDHLRVVVIVRRLD